MSDHSTAVSNVIPFRFEERPVRTLLIDDQPWFAMQDILSSLEYSKTFRASKAAGHVPEQWKGVHPIHTPGGTQDLLMLSEQGLYFFLGRSDKPKALPFQMWLAGEVLPSIRKHGRYIDSDNRMGTLIGQTIGTDGFHCLAAVLDGKVRRLPAKIRRGAKNHIWSQVHKAFSVVSVEDIPASAMDSVRTFIAAYALEGEWLPKEVPISGFGALIGRPLGRVERWLVSCDYKGDEQYQQIPMDACVMSQRDLMKAMTMPEVFVTTEDMFQFTMAALNVLKVRSDGQAQQIANLKRRA